MPNLTEPAAEEAMKLIAQAAQQYEDYLRAVSIARLPLESTELETSPSHRGDWTHPLGLVITGTRP